MLRGLCCCNNIVLNVRAPISAPVKDMRLSKRQVLWQTRACIPSVYKHYK